MTRIVKTDWLAHVENILAQGRRVADLIFNAESVLVYCPSGNVGTPLLTSLAQLFLDPYYRTFDGFRVLVFKEWVYYRHNFLKEF
jgi:myotubularin-related protein 6/7/8